MGYRARDTVSVTGTTSTPAAVALGRPIVARRSLRARRTRYFPLRGDRVTVIRGVTPAGDPERPVGGSIALATRAPPPASTAVVPPRGVGGVFSPPAAGGGAPGGGRGPGADVPAPWGEPAPGAPPPAAGGVGGPRPVPPAVNVPLPSIVPPPLTDQVNVGGVVNGIPNW